MTRSLGSVVAAVLVVLAVVLVIVGVLYLHDTAKALPAFLPGHQHHGKYHETHKAVVAFVAAGVAALAGAGAVAVSRRRPA